MRLTCKFALLVIINGCSSLVHAHGAESGNSSSTNGSIEINADASLSKQLDSLFPIAESDPARAGQLLERLLADPRFATQEAGLRHDAYSLSTWLALQVDDYRKALTSARERVAADPNVMEDWYPLAMLEHHAGNNEGSAKALSHLLRTWPEQASALEAGFVSQMVYQSKLQPAARIELVQALVRADWMQGRSANSNLWYELTLMQLLNGQVELARESAQKVFSAEPIIRLRSDKQFDSLIDRDSPSFDVGMAARKEIDSLQRLASAAPDSLELRNELNDAMLMAGMTDAALIHADLILAKMAQMSSDDPLFMDMDAKIWTMNNRAVALRRLGRGDEAIRQLETASKLDENGHPNVSQVLNLAQAYCSMGQPQKARETLAQLGGSLSPYGEMVKASTEHRIAVQTQDAAAARRAMDYLRENRNFSQSLYLWALLETNQLDQAADLMKGLLASPADRGDALEWAQESLEAPQQPADVIPEANFKAVLAREDVKSAIAAVGHVERYPIFTGYMKN